MVAEVLLLKTGGWFPMRFLSHWPAMGVDLRTSET